MEELVVTDDSNANWLALIFLIASALAVFRGHRSFAVSAFLLTALFIPLGQQFVFFGLHFRFYRLLILLGTLRVLLRGEYLGFEYATVDRLFLAWAIVTLLCGLLRGLKAELFGVAYDALGTFFLFRFWMREGDDAMRQTQVLALAAVALAGFMAYELMTHRNLFSVFGGVPEITLEREGRFRCQGPFRHPILAGTFAATTFPLLIALWLAGQHRKTAVAGLAACAFATYVAASSGALLTLIAAVAGLALWPLRRRMRGLRYLAAALLLVVALIMNPPVWYLISKVSDLAGGTGWYRSHLIDQAVRHFGEWALIGSNYTAHWASDMFNVLPMDPNNIDITNHYIEQGLKGGIVGLGLFVAMIRSLFKSIGSTISAVSSPNVHTGLAWCFGVSLFAHATAFISVSYFDQILVFWFWLLASIPALLASQIKDQEIVKFAGAESTHGTFFNAAGLWTDV